VSVKNSLLYLFISTIRFEQHLRYDDHNRIFIEARRVAGFAVIPVKPDAFQLHINQPQELHCPVKCQLLRFHIWSKWGIQFSL